jgi:hypothetical protein
MRGSTHEVFSYLLVVSDFLTHSFSVTLFFSLWSSPFIILIKINNNRVFQNLSVFSAHHSFSVTFFTLDFHPFFILLEVNFDNSSLIHIPNNLVSIRDFRCTSTPLNPVYPRSVDPST